MLLFLYLLFASLGEAFWRMPCGNFPGIHRIDPIINPGSPSAHAHSIHGGSNFGLKTSYEDLIGSPCTSCAVKEDKSAYWIPALVFRYKNGTVQAVRQVGGILAYYNLFPVGSTNIKAFPAGFRMIAGDTSVRQYPWAVPEPEKSLWTGKESSEAALRQKALGFNCLHYDPKLSPESSLGRHLMPEKPFIDANCPDGLRLEVAFPSCWNGKDLDSPDHRSHVAYSSLVLDGTCPHDYPVRLPTLFYETIWAVQDYKGIDGQFVLSNDDVTGYGNHADFITGWDSEYLQSVIHTCTNLSGQIEDCPLFTLKEPYCDKFSPPLQIQRENCAGPREGLCGDVQEASPVVDVEVLETVIETVTAAYVSAATPQKRHVHGHHRVHGV